MRKLSGVRENADDWRQDRKEDGSRQLCSEGICQCWESWSQRHTPMSMVLTQSVPPKNVVHEICGVAHCRSAGDRGAERYGRSERNAPELRPGRHIFRRTRELAGDGCGGRIASLRVDTMLDRLSVQSNSPVWSPAMAQRIPGRSSQRRGITCWPAKIPAVTSRESPGRKKPNERGPSPQK